VRVQVQQNITNVTTIVAPTTNILAVGAWQGIDPELRRAGWPERWPVVAPPRPITAQNFTIPFDVLLRALAANAERADACRGGDPTAVAALLVEVVRLLHADPQERNMYLSPNRADQVLVYVPERWRTLPLRDGISLALARAADGLADTLPLIAPPLQGVAQAARDGFQAKRDEVVERSRGAMAAHLEDLAALARCGESGAGWLGDLAGQPEVEQPRVFGDERFGHLPVPALVAALELDTGVYCAADLEAAGVPAVAQRAVVVFGRALLAGHPENLTVLLAPARAHVHTARGWRPTTEAAAARSQALSFAALLARYLAMPGAELFAEVGHYLEREGGRVADLVGESRELLSQYARAAAAYYGATTGATLEAPRRLLLLGGGPGLAPGSSGPLGP
jgi:hypothetical protein